MIRYFRRHPVLGLFALLLLSGLGYAARREYRHRRAEAHYQSALERSAAFRYEAAYDHIRKAAALRPGRADIRFLAARTARRVLDMPEAKRHLDECAKALGDTNDVRLEKQLLAAQLGTAGHFAEETLWLRARADPANRALILEALLRGALDTYRLNHARKAIDAWLEEPTGDARPYFWRGVVYEQYGESLKERALQDYQLSLEKNSDFDECRLRLAELQLKTGRTTDARSHFAELRHRLPDNADVATGLAQCEDAAGRTEIAQQLLDEALAKDGNHPGALRLRGMLLVHQGRAADAEPWLRRAYDAMPQDPATSYNYFQCLQQQGKEKEAKEQQARHAAMTAKQDRLRQLIREEVTSRPNDPAVLCEIGTLYLDTGRPEWLETGRMWLERALAADAAHKPTFAALAQYYDRKNRPDLAAQCRAKAK